MWTPPILAFFAGLSLYYSSAIKADSGSSSSFSDIQPIKASRGEEEAFRRHHRSTKGCFLFFAPLARRSSCSSSCGPFFQDVLWNFANQKKKASCFLETKRLHRRRSLSWWRVWWGKKWRDWLLFTLSHRVHRFKWLLSPGTFWGEVGSYMLKDDWYSVSLSLGMQKSTLQLTHLNINSSFGMLTVYSK